MSDDVLAIQARGLCKSYRSQWTLKVVHGLRDLDLEVERGEVLGYLGPNGSGKTTTLKLLTGLLRPTSGQAWVLGESIENPASRARLGFLPERPYFYDHLNGIEYLELAAQLSGLHGHEASKRAKHWFGRVGLGERYRLSMRKYSKGMLQRVGLASALIHEPEIVILDEPMSGLDPFGRRDVRDLIVEQRERGATVLFSSHILPDVEMVASRIAILREGQLVRTGTIEQLVEARCERVEIRCRNAPVLEIPEDLESLLSRFERPEGTTFVLEDDDHLNEVVQWLIGSGARLAAVTPQRANLEDMFLETMREAKPEDGASDSEPPADHEPDQQIEVRSA